MTPRRRYQKLDETYFGVDAKTAMEGLLAAGAHLVRTFENGSQIVGKLHEIAAYEGNTDTSSEGMLYEPGILTVSTKRGKHLIDISTGNNGESSCITLISALFDWGGRKQLVRGPGNLAKALQITPEYDGRPINGTDFWIELREAYKGEFRERKKSNASSNFIKQIYIPYRK